MRGLQRSSIERSARLSGEVPPALRQQALALLGARAESLHARAVAGDAMRCYSTCQEIRTLADRIGIAPTVRAADAAIGRLSATMSADDSSVEIGELMRACQHATGARKSA